MKHTEQLSEQDYELVRLVLEEGMSKEKAVEALEYPAKTKAGRIQTANRVIRIYTSQASSRDILRQSGVDEAYIARKLRQILDSGTNNEKLKAIDIATKCLGLQKDVAIDGGAMIQINLSTDRAPDYVDGSDSAIGVVHGDILSVRE